jgi:hypothetical protein
VTLIGADVTHLQADRLVGCLAARGLVNAAGNKIVISAERSAERFPAPEGDLDARGALEHMRDTLGELANHEHTYRPSTTPQQI